MKGYYDAKLTEALALSTGESYDVAYEYDVSGRITKETVTGSISREVIYAYDNDDNITTETITVNGNIITKTYSYDIVSGNITNIKIAVS